MSGVNKKMACPGEPEYNHREVEERMPPTRVPIDTNPGTHDRSATTKRGAQESLPGSEEIEAYWEGSRNTPSALS